MLELPTLGNRIPKRGNPLSRTFGRLILRAFGWRFEGPVPDREKFIIVVAPHTSNWDFVFGMASVFALGVRAHWMGKHTLFKGPVGNLMRWMGGIPINRSTRGGVVSKITEEFQRRETLVLGIAPEGTRRKVSRWKTGFYHIARSAGVPIAPGSIDYGKKTVGLGPLFALTGDLDDDMEKIQSFYRNVTGKNSQ